MPKNSLQRIRNACLKYWWIPLSTFILSFGSSFIYVSNTPDIYRSSALLAPVSQPDSSSLSGLGSIGGLASVAGINIGGGGSERAKIALKMLQATELVNDFVEQNNLNIIIFASNGWDLESDVAIIDEKIYRDNSWVRDVRYPKVPEPSDYEIAKKFLDDYLNIHEEPDSGFVTLSIDFYSPKVANIWLSKFITLINEKIRDKDIEDAQLALQYLENQVFETESAELKKVLYEMMEEQHKKLMLAVITENYAFEIINPPSLVNESFYPKRLLIVIITTLLGGFLGVYTSILLYHINDNVKD